MSEMQRLDPDHIDSRRRALVGLCDELRTIAPDLFTEDGLDTEALRRELFPPQEECAGRYSFTWNGKEMARRIVQTPSTGTLRPCPEDSANWDTTRNLFIEGDNLEVLKLLQKSYHKRIKMIYIDPPYNTGKEFVYPDDFRDNVTNYLAITGQSEDDGRRLSANTETSGRYHTDWLNMMYPRLKLARTLLRDDGVLFVSIDDNEVANLRKVCDELFGEENFIACITREAIKGGSLSKYIRITHDYLLVFAKSLSEVTFTGYEKDEIVLDQEDERGPYSKGRELNKWGAGSRREDSPSMWFPIDGPNGEEVYPIRNDGSEGRWRLGRARMAELVKNGDVIFEKRENGTYIAYEKIREQKSGITQFISIFKDKYINAKGTERVKALFQTERSYFDYVKPVELVYDLCVMADIDDDDIVLDFFSGSSTSADAVVQYCLDFGKRVRFMMVQLPEVCGENSEAAKAGFSTIAEIGKERIRRVFAAVEQEEKAKLLETNADLGFRAFFLDSSNIKPWDADFDNVEQTLWDSVENIKPERGEVDVLFELLLKYGLDLSIGIEERTLCQKSVFVIGAGALVVCLTNEVDLALVEAIAALKDELQPEIMRVVFKDSGFKNDVVKANAVQVLRQAGIEDVKSL